MADYVVDASAVMQHFIADTYTVEAGILLAGMESGDRLNIPEFCLLECVNVFWKNVRFRGLPATDAADFVVELLDLPFQIFPVNNLLPRALQIGLTSELAIYDSLYIALALSLGCPLITIDEKQLNAAVASGVTIKPISDFSPES